jgi:hypothetical protein
MPGQAGATIVTYDPDNEWLLLSLGDRTLHLEPVEQVRFQRGDQDSPDAYALWLDAGRADVLAKMIDYILGKIKISEASQETLRQLLPEVRQIAASLGSPDDMEG